MYGADPRHFHLGTKSGCRRLFAEEGVPHPLGVEDLQTLDDVVDAIAAMRAERPDVAQAIVKLNEGVSGEGNASVDLRGLPAPGADGERDAIARAPPARCSSRSPAPTLDALPREARRARRHRRGAHRRRRVPQPERPAARHAARRGRAALDPRPAARRAERPDATSAAASPPTRRTRRRSRARRRRSAQRLAARGRARPLRARLRRRCATKRRRGTPYAIEINLRKGGTTHPFLTLQFLTDGALRRRARRLHGAARAARSTSSPATTSSRRPTRASRTTISSTSSRATACTSTSRGRPASCST